MELSQKRLTTRIGDELMKNDVARGLLVGFGLGLLAGGVGRVIGCLAEQPNTDLVISPEKIEFVQTGPGYPRDYTVASYTLQTAIALGTPLASIGDNISHPGKYGTARTAGIILGIATTQADRLYQLFGKLLE